jgi:hypothetical protein
VTATRLPSDERRLALRFLAPRADVDEPKSGENCMHLDIDTPTVDAEVARLEELGARRLAADAIEEPGNR